MQRASSPLGPGLYLVATPIGSARDVTLRALDILRDADVIAAEDTRTARKLMEIHGIATGGRPMIAYHDHNGPAARPKVMQALKAGQSVAYVSEAGTPMVADPGYQLVQDAQAADIRVFAAPGASAILAALCVAGLPTDRFFFAGFPPNASSARRRFLEDLKPVPGTLVLYESPKRITKMLEDVLACLGDRPCVLCRELTKKFEETRRGSVSEVLETTRTTPPKGEIVLVLGAALPTELSDADIEAALTVALETMRVKDAAAKVAAEFGVSKRDAYQLALGLSQT